MSSPEPRGVFENTTYEGVVMVDSYDRSALSGWATVTAVPKSTVTEPMRQQLLLVLLGEAWCSVSP